MKVSYKKSSLQELVNANQSYKELVSVIKEHKLKSTMQAKNFYVWLSSYPEYFNTLNVLYISVGTGSGSGKGKHHLIMNLYNL